MLSALIAAFIFYMSAQNSNSSSGMSGGLIRFFIDLFPKFKNLPETSKEIHIENLQFFVRKAAHWSVYFSLGLFSSLALFTHEMRFYKRPLIAAGSCLTYAISDEIHQLFIPGRSGEIRDVLIDFSGSIIAILIVVLINKKRASSSKDTK